MLLKYIWIAQAGRCFYCGHALKARGGNSPYNATREHVFPRSQYTKPHNIVWACRQCNETKGNREPTISEVCRMRSILLRSKDIQTGFDTAHNAEKQKIFENTP